MRDTETLKYIDVIRESSRTMARSPFAAGAIVEACSSAERWGIPRKCCLHASALEYTAVFQDSVHLAACLAGRVGDPRVSPVPPLWPVLAILLLAWRNTIPPAQVLQRATQTRTENEVQRGLAIVTYLFPELQSWLAEIVLEIPRWERTFAVPLATRKLVQLESTTTTEQPIGPTPWRVTGGTQRGISHVRTGLKNQDAIQYLSCEDATSVVLAVADGHGSDLSFRSDAGSRLAVDAAVEVLRRFSRTVRIAESRSVITNRAQTLLTQELTQSWRAAVQKHLQAKPFTQTEWSNLAALEGWDGQHIVRRRPEVAYGTTVLAVLATETYVLCLQLGDGDILFVDTQGNTRRAVPEHEAARRQTASMSRRSAGSLFRVHVQLATENLPAMIVAATDGYAETYESDDQFLETGRDLLRMLGAEGFDGIERQLRFFLGETSARGSEDDVTVGFISRFDRLETEKTIPHATTRFVSAGRVS